MPGKSVFQHTGIGLIILSGFLFRLYAIDFGLPLINARPDEIIIINRALGFFSGDLNPHGFNWPSLYPYLLFFALAFYFSVRSLIPSAFPDADADLISQFIQATQPARHIVSNAETVVALDPYLPHVYIISRGISVLAGTFTIFIVYLIAKRLYDQRTALIGAFFMSTCYLHIRDSHFGTTDVLMTCLIMTSFLFIVQCALNPNRQNFVLAGVFAGLSISAKYAGVLLFVPTVFACIFPLLKSDTAPADNASETVSRFLSANLRNGVNYLILNRNLMLFLICMAIAFVVTTPYAILDYKTFLTNFFYEMNKLKTGHHPDWKLDIGWYYHIRYSLYYGMGLMLFAASLMGVIFSIRKNWKTALLLFSFPFVYWVINGKNYAVFTRYIIPVLPFLCIFAAVFVVKVTDKLKLQSNLAIILLCLLIAYPSIDTAVEFNTMIAKKDNRLVASDWLNKNIKKTYTYIQRGTPWGQIPLNDHFVSFKSSGEQPSNRKANHTEIAMPDLIMVQQTPLKFYDNHSDEFMNRIEMHYFLLEKFIATPSQVPKTWYDQLDAFYVPFKGFEGVDRPGPNLYIYAHNGLKKVFDNALKSDR